MTRPKILDYARSSSTSRYRQIVGIACLSVAGLVAVGLGADLAYRIELFYGTYGAKPGLNHVGDFASRYVLGVAGTIAAVMAGLLIGRRITWLVAICLGAVCLIACLAFMQMHRTGALVEYGEWANMCGP